MTTVGNDDLTKDVITQYASNPFLLLHGAVYSIYENGVKLFVCKIVGIGQKA